MNEEYLICYGFTFNICVRSKNGKIYKTHRVSAIGLTYSFALWDMRNKLKHRGMQLQAINSVTIDRIEFALDNKGRPVQLNLSQYLPTIPDNLNTKEDY